MAQSIGTTAASSELSGTGSITNFTSAASSGVLLSFVFSNGAETASSVFTMGGGSLTWGFVAAYFLPTSGAGGQSIFMFAAPFAASISATTFTLTPHAPNSSRWGFILVEADGSQNTYDPAPAGSGLLANLFPATGVINSTSVGGISPASTTVLLSSPSGQKFLSVVSGTGAGFKISNVASVNNGGGTAEQLLISTIGATSLTMSTNLVNTHSPGEPVSMTGTAITTTNTNDIILAAVVDSSGGTDTIVGSGGYTTAISTQNFHLDVGSACGVIYQVVSSTGTYNPTCTTTNGGITIMSVIAIEATSVAPSTNNLIYMA